jgi:preprotein translocase SecE subunit
MAENKTKVRRFKADAPTDGKKPKKTVKAKAKNSKKTPKLTAPNWLKAVGRSLNKVFGPIGRYVKGSWQELRMTKWPNRRSTWGLTVAVILFSIFFAVLILSFDNLFEWILETILNMKGNS